MSEEAAQDTRVPEDLDDCVDLLQSTRLADAVDGDSDSLSLPQGHQHRNGSTCSSASSKDCPSNDYFQTPSCSPSMDTLPDHFKMPDASTSSTEAESCVRSHGNTEQHLNEPEKMEVDESEPNTSSDSCFGYHVKNFEEHPSFIKHLKELGLESFYPRKLRKKNLIKVYPSDVSPSFKEAKGSMFLKRLLNANTKCRDIFSSQENEDVLLESDDVDVIDDETEECNYHTAIMIIFMCADPFLRRYLVEKMLMCQFAVPFILPLTKETLLWPTRVVKNWSNCQSGIVEGFLSSESMPMLSVLQVGEYDRPISSELLNEIFQERGYEGFRSETWEGSNGIAEGLVEISWYLPRGRESDAFQQAFVAANLHGDAENCADQVRYLLEVSSCVILVTDSVDRVQKIVGDTFSEKVIVALWTTKNKIKQVLRANKSRFTTIPLTHASDIKKYTKQISTLLFTTSRSLLDRAYQSKTFHFHLDEHEPHCIKGKQRAKEVMEDINKLDLYKTREIVLPFQENWKDWVKLDKEQTRRKNLVNAEMAKSFVEDRQMKKLAIEKNQTYETQSECFIKFFSFLRRNNDNERLFFLEWLRLFLNERSQQVLNEQQCKLEKHGQEETVLAQLRKNLASSSLGLEHFLRELSMFWMALRRQNSEEESIRWLPKLAAFLLLEGYPMEILDGDASYVPLLWMKEVFCFLKEYTGKQARVFVTSILGVQSSGKSTFLNSMFGINFSVSSGRCTRGAFIQLVEVDHAVRKQLGCDYVLVVDTEGLKSAEQEGYDNEHDNELGTMAVGIADLSVMNIGGENDDSMKDVLQIICYAFLRMTVTLKERPKCMMVHQNVGDLAASKKTTAGKLKFFQTLDDMTKLAAEMEKCDKKYQKFSDVIEYDPQKMDIYIPGLWQGSPPMAAVNIDYSEAAEKTKRTLLEEIRSKKSSTFDVFLTRIRDINIAVKEENFIFSFQNTVAAKAFQNLSQHYDEKKWEEKTKVIDWVVKTELMLKELADYTNNRKQKVVADGEEIAETYAKSLETTLNDYFSEHEELASILERNRALFEADIASTRTQARAEVRKRIDEMFYWLKNEEKAERVVREGENHFKPRLMQLKAKYSIAEDHLTPEQKANLEKDFEDEWLSFLNGLEQPEQNEEESITDLMSNILRNNIRDQSHHLQATCSTQLKYKVTNKDVILARDFQTHKRETRSGILSWISNKVTKNPHEKLLQRAQYQADLILQSCHKKVHELTEPTRMFREDFCHDILIFTTGLLEKTDDQDFAFSMYFRVNLLQVVSRYASEKLTRMQEEYKEEQDPRRRLDKSKIKYFNLLLSLVETGNHVKVFASEITSGIVPAVQRQFEVLLRDIIVEECLELCNCRQMHLKMCTELHEEGNFEMYKFYLSNFKGFALTWLRSRVVKFLNTPKEDGCNRFFEMLKKKSYDTLDAFVKAMQLGQVEDDDFQKYLVKLQKVCSERSIHLGLDQNCIGRLAMLPVQDVKSFKNEILEQLQRDANMVLESSILKLDVEEELNRIEPSIEEQLYEKLMCDAGEQCPFCAAPCGVIGPHQQHRAEMHQPEGLRGTRWTANNRLVETECPVSIALNHRFKNEKTNQEYVSYQRYQEFYPNWDIPSDADPSSTKYWKMVLQDYNEKLAEWYSVDPADIPESWKGYQWPVVKKDLHEIYES